MDCKNYPRVHGNMDTRPSNAFSFEVVYKAVQLIQNCAEQYALPQPASMKLWEKSYHVQKVNNHYFMN